MPDNDDAPICHGGCGRRVLMDEGPLSYCRTCWFVEAICSLHGAANLRELGEQHERILSAKWRIMDLVRRAAPDEADILLHVLERRLF